MSNKFPPELVRKLGTDPLFDAQSFLETHEAAASVTSVRINPRKTRPLLAAEGLPSVPWCDTGLYLPERPVFTLDPFFHAGCYYVQEASSLFVAQVITELGLDAEPCTAVDLCAAPGGKSTLLQSYLHPDSLLIANELIKSRVGILEENLTRWGYPNTIIAHSDPSAFARLPDFADLLLVDAPCSGSGMFRKDQQALDEWSEAAVRLCSERQQRILASSLDCLKSGGTLIYSTCSYSEEENEQIADWLVDTFGLESVRVPYSPEWGIVESPSPKHACAGYRFYPHKLQGEGFFLAVFRKPGPSRSPGKSGKSGKPDKSNHSDKNHLAPKALERWVMEPDNYYNFMIGDQLHVIAERLKADFFAVQKVLYLKNAGLRIGKAHKGEILIPDHALALSTIQNADLPKLALDYKTALDYLRKQGLSNDLPAGQALGWSLATYGTAVLGWVKIMPGRINNYYPKDSRIVNL